MTRRLHAYASERHFVDHLQPIWAGLDVDERGVFWCGAKDATRRAVELDVGEWRHGRPKPGDPGGLWMVASMGDLRRLGVERRFVFVEHGAGQTYRDARGMSHYPGGPGRHRVDLFLCPNHRVAEANLAVYPGTRAVVVGCPKLDRYRRDRDPTGRSARPPVVAFTWHWDPPPGQIPELRSAWPFYGSAIQDAVAGYDQASEPWRMVGHAHPRAWTQMAKWYDTLPAVQPVQHLDDVLCVADVVVADNTSAMFEAAALDIPVVVLNAPWYRRDVNHGLRFWEMADVGVQVDAPTGLVPAITETVAVDPQRDRRGEVAAELYGSVDGNSVARAVQAIRTALH